jgi:hypothetical protein
VKVDTSIGNAGCLGAGLSANKSKIARGEQSQLRWRNGLRIAAVTDSPKRLICLVAAVKQASVDRPDRFQYQSFCSMRIDDKTCAGAAQSQREIARGWPPT